MLSDHNPCMDGGLMCSVVPVSSGMITAVESCVRSRCSRSARRASRLLSASDWTPAPSPSGTWCSAGRGTIRRRRREIRSSWRPTASPPITWPAWWTITWCGSVTCCAAPSGWSPPLNTCSCTARCAGRRRPTLTCRCCSTATAPSCPRDRETSVSSASASRACCLRPCWTSSRTPAPASAVSLTSTRQLLGVGTELGAFKGTDRIASVLRSTGSH